MFLQLDPQRVNLYYKEHCKSIKDGSTMKNAEGFKFVKKTGASKADQPDVQQAPWMSLGGMGAPLTSNQQRKQSFN